VHSVTVQSVTVQSVTVQSVTVHSVTVHSVTVQSVTLHSVTVHSVTVHSVTVQSVIVQSVLLLQRNNIKMLSHNHAKLVLRPSATQNSAKFPQKTFLFYEANSVFLQRNLIPFNP